MEASTNVAADCGASYEILCDFQGRSGNFVSERLKSWLGMVVVGTVSIRSAGIPWGRVPGNNGAILLPLPLRDYIPPTICILHRWLYVVFHLEKYYNFLFLISREITVFLENLQCRKIIINPICFQK